MADARVTYRVDEALPILRATPATLRALLGDLPDSWTAVTEGDGTWSPYDVVGHLIHGERDDWIPRAKHLLEHGESRPFTPFDREAMFEASRGKSLAELLDTFAELRTESVEALGALRLTDEDLTRRGVHPEFGSVTLGQHLATWVAHDLCHLGQVARTMAKRYAGAVGPWAKYLTILS